MKKMLIGLSMSGLVIAPGAFALGTPDGQPPAIEEVCSDYKGVAFGLCNAYCEAQDCDMHRRPSCELLRGNFERLTGNPLFPCDQAVEPGCSVVGYDGPQPLCGGTCDIGTVCVSFADSCACMGDR